MNPSTILTCILLAVLNMISCEKEEDDPEPIVVPTAISRHLYQNCSKTPYANLDLFFYERRFRGLNFPEEKYLGNTTTDENGFFLYDPGYCTSSKDIFVLDANGIEVFGTGCSGDAGYPKTDLTAEGNTEHIIKILTHKPFTPNDTLYLGIRGRGRNEIVRVGPFSNNETFKSEPVGLMFSPKGYALLPVGYSQGSSAWWGIGKAEFDQVSTNPTFQKPPNLLNDITQVVCGMGDTIVVDLRGY